MSAPENLYKTYETVGLREDLADVIKNISPVDTPIYSGMSEGGANAIKVEWQTDALADAAANAQLEGDAETIAAVTATTRVYNICQIQKKLFGISNTNAATSVKRAGRVSEKDYQTAKKSKELAKDIEYAFIRGSLVAGDATTARAMRGLMNWITTNVSKAADATMNSTTGVITGGTDRTFTSTILEDMLQDIWTDGGNPSVMYTTPTLKRVVSGWTQSTANYRVAVEDNKLDGTVDVYVSDFGTVTIKPHRDMPAGVAIILDPAHKGKKGTLRNTHREQLGITGDNQQWVIRVEHTLRDVGELALGRITNLKA